MKAFIELIVCFFLVVITGALICYFGYTYYHHSRNPIEHAVEEVVKNVVGIDIDDYIEDDSTQSR
jgi:hypothetical protein